MKQRSRGIPGGGRCGVAHPDSDFRPCTHLFLRMRLRRRAPLVDELAESDNVAESVGIQGGRVEVEKRCHKVLNIDRTDFTHQDRSRLSEHILL